MVFRCTNPYLQRMIFLQPLLASLMFYGSAASLTTPRTLTTGEKVAVFEDVLEVRKPLPREDEVTPEIPYADRYNASLYQKYFYDSVGWLQPVECLATFISRTVAIVPCECVVRKPTSTSNAVNHLTHEGWKKTEGGDAVELIPISEGKFEIEPYVRRSAGKVNAKVKHIVKHPNCTTLMKYNIALVEISRRFDWVRIAWVHTPEDILFSNNMRRIVAGQAITGRCTAPWIDITNHDTIRPNTWEVDFQYWDACRSIVCPNWSREYKRFSDYVNTFENPSAVPYVRNVCVDEVDRTKFCVRIRIPLYQRQPESCSLTPGLPVYCNMGRYSGLFGFIVSRTFGCSKAENYDLAIFQPLSIVIPFIQDYLMISNDPAYNSKLEQKGDVTPYVPEWAVGVERKPPTQAEYNSATVRQALPRSGPLINSLLQTFADDQADSVVNVYFEAKERSHFRCQGVQFTPTKYIVPCFCVYRHDYNLYKINWGDPQHYTEVIENTEYGEIMQLTATSLNVRYAKYDNGQPEKCRPVTDDASYQAYGEKKPFINWDKYPYCHFLTYIHKPEWCSRNALFDFAYIETKVPLQWAKNVWIHSANSEYMKNMMRVLPVSSLIGGQCFVLSFTYIPQDPNNPQVLRSVKTKKIDVIFSPWDFCLPLICDPDFNYHQYERWQTELCFNYNLVNAKGSPFSNIKGKYEHNARDCISAVHGEPICDLPDGTPVFCDTDEIRGLVGIISKVNMPGCTQTKKNYANKRPREEVNRYGANSSAIIMKFSEYLSEIAKDTIIYKIINTDAFKNRLSGAPLRVASLLFTALSATMTSALVSPKI